jgi:hypothetical protein
LGPNSGSLKPWRETGEEREISPIVALAEYQGPARKPRPNLGFDAGLREPENGLGGIDWSSDGNWEPTLSASWELGRSSWHLGLGDVTWTQIRQARSDSARSRYAGSSQSGADDQGSVPPNANRVLGVFFGRIGGLEDAITDALPRPS